MKKPIIRKNIYFFLSALTLVFTFNNRINAQCTAAFSASTYVVCGSGSVSFTNSSSGTGLTYSWNFGDPKSGSKDTSTAKNPSHTYNKTGIYTVRLIITDGTCTDSIKKTITVRETPIVRGDTALCVGTYKIGNPAVSGYSYEWRDMLNSFKLISTLSNPTISFYSSGDRIYYVKATNTTNGVTCTVSDTFIVHVLRYSKASAGISKTICSGDSAVLGSKADTGSYYQWTSDPAGFNSNLANPVVRPTVTTKYFLYATNKLSGCAKADTIIINIPSQNISGDSITCEFSGKLYSVTALKKATYSWNVTGGTITSGQGTEKIIVDWAATGKGKITVKVTDTLSCSSYGSINNITINPQPSTRITGDTLVCNNYSGYIYSTQKNTGNFYKWSINGGSIISGQYTENIKVNWLNSGNGTISVYESNSLGCTNSYNYNVKILQGAKPKIIGDTNICGNAINQDYFTDSVSGNTYKWSVTGGTITSGQGTNNIKVNWPKTGTGYITVKESSNNGCADSFSLKVNINDWPNPKITGDTIVCKNFPSYYSTKLDTGSKYLWSVNGGTIKTGQGTNQISVTWTVNIPGKVTVKETNTSGCDSTISLNNIIINPIPSPKISGDTIVCNNISNYSTSNITGNSYLWKINGGTINSGQGTNNIKVSWSISGKGTISVKETNPYGCSDSSLINITIIQSPKPKITGDTVVCQFSNNNDYKTALVTGNSYKWSVIGGTISAGQGTNNIKVSWLKSGSISVKEITSTGCADSFSYKINVNARPNPKISGDTVVCNNLTNVYSTKLDTGSKYLWTISGGTIISGQSTNQIKVNWTANSSGLVSLKEINSFGCDTTVSLNNITINPAPSPKISGDTIVCNNISGYNYSTTNNPGNSYLWKITGGTINSGQGTNNIKVSWSTSGKGTISVKETNSYGCSDSSLINITIIQSPKPKITGDSVVCQYSYNNDYKTALVTGNSYKWSVTGGTISAGQGTNNIKVNWFKSGTGSISVKEITSTGCTDSFYINNIKINTRPEPKITGDSSVCNNILSNYSTLSNAGNNYSWSINGGTIISGQNTNQIKVIWAGSGKGSLNLKETNSLGCDSTVSLINISINLKPVVSIKGDSEVCIGSIYNYTSANRNTNFYKWQITGGKILTGQNTDSIQVEWTNPNPSLASLKLVETTSFGCTDSVTFPVSVYLNPAGKISGSIGICQGTIENYSSSNISNSSYSWKISNGGKILSGQGTKDITVQWVTAGNNSVSLIQSNLIGCANTDSLNVKVFTLPKANFVSTPTCIGKPVYFKDSNISAIKYKWDFGDSSTSDSINPIHTYSQVGTYKVKLSVISSNGCSDSVIKTLIVNKLPDPSFSLKDVCEGDSSIFIPKDTSASTHFWKFGNGITSNLKIPKLIFKNPDSYIVTHYIINNSSGCLDSLSKTVKIYDLPNSKFTTKKLSDTLFSFTANDSTLVSYLWNFGDGFTDTSANPTHTYSKDSTYKVTLNVINANGCEGDSDTSITVKTFTAITKTDKPEINVLIYPNPFTNATTIKYTLTEIAKVKLSIYDITGKEIIKITESTQPAGTYINTLDASKTKMPAGVYFVKILINDLQLIKQVIKLQ